MRSQLEPLISEPREDLAVEYKTWLDLDQNEAKATLAKACIALANHGGGFLILGFDEQGNTFTSIAKPSQISEITQDSVNSAILRYADPVFHCQLYPITHPKTGVSHPVISIPSDQTVPIMSKRDCQGIIRQHRCYIRKPGPCSEEPKTSEEWRTLLRRCVQGNREDMLSAIRSIMVGRTESETSTPVAIQEFAEFCAGSFELWKELIEGINPDYPERLPNGYYEISVQPVGAAPVATLNILQERLSHARRVKMTGWSPFLDMTAEEWRPTAVNDHIEAWIGRRTDERIPREPQHSDYWRISRKGQLYTLRGYTEDSLEERRRVPPGSVMDVTLPVWRVGEILYFAVRFLGEFESVRSILINCRFTGLSGRTITSLTSSRWTSSRACRSKEVETHASVTLQQIEENMVEIVHQLLTPLYEAFDLYTLSRTLVEEELRSLREKRL